jgi:hypothetical protein
MVNFALIAVSCIVIPVAVFSLPAILILLPIIAPVVLTLAGVVVAYLFLFDSPPRKSVQRSVEVDTDTRRNIRFSKHLVSRPDPNLQTVADVFRSSVARFGDNPALGWRKVVRTEPREKKVERNGETTILHIQHPYLTSKCVCVSVCLCVCVLSVVYLYNV